MTHRDEITAQRKGFNVVSSIRVKTIPVVREILGRVRDLAVAGDLRSLADLLARFHREAWEEGWIDSEVAAKEKRSRPAKIPRDYGRAQAT